MKFKTDVLLVPQQVWQYKQQNQQ